MLWGGYLEERVDLKHNMKPYVKLRRPFRLNYIPLDGFHAIRELPNGHCWTLCFDWPPVQRIGYWVEDHFESIGRYYLSGRDNDRVDNAANWKERHAVHV